MTSENRRLFENMCKCYNMDLTVDVGHYENEITAKCWDFWRESKSNEDLQYIGKINSIFEKLKCIEFVLHNVPEININNYDISDIEELDGEKIKAHELLKIVIAQMESWDENKRTD